ncbi:cytochrome c maturation protein CcmE [Pseudodesulfovibrio pelocollis]|uniref:cytochrome c maturation protein CcmE n=1 Tax=Pseudodesulfovibrio pelocollis TaxID=3051432 RepID=UPI00255AA6B7|nr:cytochrome c maturation protein CcmE [Pseudodesulfovibrio sp. SB368]
MAKKTNKTVYAVALTLFLGGLGYLIFSGLSQDSVYFLNVSEALAVEPGEVRQARLFGKVSPEGLVLDPDNLGTSFTLIDKMDPTKTMRVQYRGALPDTFKEDVEVILEGGLDPSASVFTARTLVTKCPSKYEEESRQMEQSKG